MAFNIVAWFMLTLISFAGIIVGAVLGQYTVWPVIPFPFGIILSQTGITLFIFLFFRGNAPFANKITPLWYALFILALLLVGSASTTGVIVAAV